MNALLTILFIASLSVNTNGVQQKELHIENAIPAIRQVERELLEWQNSPTDSNPTPTINTNGPYKFIADYLYSADGNNYYALRSFYPVRYTDRESERLDNLIGALDRRKETYRTYRFNRRQVNDSRISDTERLNRRKRERDYRQDLKQLREEMGKVHREAQERKDKHYHLLALPADTILDGHSVNVIVNAITITGEHDLYPTLIIQGEIQESEGDSREE